MSKSLQVDKNINVKSSAEVSEQFYPNAPAPCLTALAPLPQLLSDAVLMEAGPGAEGRVKIIDGLIEGSTSKSARKGILEVSPHTVPISPRSPTLFPEPISPIMGTTRLRPALQTRPHTCMRVRQSHILPLCTA